MCTLLVAAELFRLAGKYQPEDAKAKKERLQAAAAAKAGGAAAEKAKKPFFIKSGLNHVTTLVENKKAQLVVIAGDVAPLEVCF